MSRPFWVTIIVVLSGELSFWFKPLTNPHNMACHRATMGPTELAVDERGTVEIPLAKFQGATVKFRVRNALVS